MEKRSVWKRLKRDFYIHKYKYLLFLPVLVYFILFHYKSMYGVVIAFQKFRISAGISGSPWVGFENFIRFFKDPYFFRVIRNTITINLLSLVFSFPAPIILALMLNEVKVSWYKRTVQTITYMPHFISTVVVCGMLTSFCQVDGVFNEFIALFGGEKSNLLSKSSAFYPIYVLSGIWQSVGWDSIIYLATLAGIDQEQYEAAKIDGAGRWKQMIYITLPGLVPTAVMLLILRMGSMMSVGSEKILLLYKPLTYEVADVISTYVYRVGLFDGQYSYSTAINLFNSVINIIFLVTANKISKKAGQSGLF